MNAISEIASPAQEGSAELDKLAAALSAAQGKFTNPPKNATNPHFRSRFASLDAIVEMARPVLAENGLAVLHLVGTAGGATVLRTRLLHTSGQWLDSVVPLLSAAKGPQVFGSELTYQKRYNLCAVLNIVADSDDDAQAAQEQQGKSRPRPPARGQRDQQQEPPHDPAPSPFVVVSRDGEIKELADARAWIAEWQMRLNAVGKAGKPVADKRATVGAMFEANAGVFDRLNRDGHEAAVAEIAKARTALFARLDEQERADRGTAA